MGVKSTGDDVESKAKWCQETLRKEPDTTAKKISIFTQSKRWLNSEIKEKRRQLGREK